MSLCMLFFLPWLAIIGHSSARPLARGLFTPHLPSEMTPCREGVSIHSRPSRRVSHFLWAHPSRGNAYCTGPST